jgi:SAM-dependent methyltransferase
LWAEVFDLSADSYDHPALRFFDLNARALVREVGLPAGAAVLDVATGTGKVAVEAAHVVGPQGRVIGVDVSAGMLERASQRATDLPVEFVRMDATSLSFPDETFDVALCGHALAFLDAERVLRELHRVLKPGGRVGISSFTKEAFMPMTLTLRNCLGIPASRRGPRTREERFVTVDDRRTMLTLLKKGGFRRRKVIREPTAYMLDGPAECWTVLWGSAWRGPLSRLPREAADRLKHELLEDLSALHGDDGIKLDASALIGIGMR